MIIVNKMIRIIVGYNLNYSDYDCQQSVLETYLCVAANSLTDSLLQPRKCKYSGDYLKCICFTMRSSHHFVYVCVCVCRKGWSIDLRACRAVLGPTRQIELWVCHSLSSALKNTILKGQEPPKTVCYTISPLHHPQFNYSNVRPLITIWLFIACERFFKAEVLFSTITKKSVAVSKHR